MSLSFFISNFLPLVILAKHSEKTRALLSFHPDSMSPLVVKTISLLEGLRELNNMDAAQRGSPGTSLQQSSSGQVGKHLGFSHFPVLTTVP